MADKKKKAQPKRKRAEKEKEPERRSTRQAKAPARFAEGDEEEKPSTRKQAAKEAREKAAKKAKVEKAKKKKEAEEKKKKKEDVEEEEEEEEVEAKESKQPPKSSDKKGKSKPPVKPEEKDDDGEEKEQQAEEDKDEAAEEEDDEEEGDIDAEALAEHQKKAPKHAKKAVQNFKKQMEVFTWKSSAKKNYILLTKNWENAVDEVFESDDWPCAFVGNEPQPVAAALYEINDKGTASILVSIWTVSLTGDESSQFYLGPAEEAVFEFAALIEKDEGKAFLGDKFEECRDSLSISSGDYKVKQFYCPALESLNVLDLKK